MHLWWFRNASISSDLGLYSILVAIIVVYLARELSKKDEEASKKKAAVEVLYQQIVKIKSDRVDERSMVCIRGHFEEYFYDENLRLTDTIDMIPGGTVLNIPVEQWHSLRSLQSGTILLEAKDGVYEPLGGEDILAE